MVNSLIRPIAGALYYKQRKYSKVLDFTSPYISLSDIIQYKKKNYDPKLPFSRFFDIFLRKFKDFLRVF